MAIVNGAGRPATQRKSSTTEDTEDTEGTRATASRSDAARRKVPGHARPYRRRHRLVCRGLSFDADGRRCRPAVARPSLADSACSANSAGSALIVVGPFFVTCTGYFD